MLIQLFSFFIVVGERCVENYGESYRRYDCRFCPKRFQKPFLLARHERIHTGEKSFKCETCLKRFITKDGFVRHVRIHTGEKPYSCELCSRSFSTSDGLKSHQVTHINRVML